MHPFFRTLCGAALALFSLSPSWATSGSVTGTISTTDGGPAVAAEVRLVDLSRATLTDSSGGFRFDDVPLGKHLLEAQHPRWGAAIAEVDVDGEVSLALRLDRAVHLDELVVTAGATARRGEDLSLGTSVLTGEELSSRIQSTLGETLAGEPGVTSTYFGPGSSRPLIRGLGGDRIRILQNGLDVGDASNTSPDHAAGADPASAERIEVLRGPATLLYGSTAIGGVVNVVSEAIPTSLPQVPVTGSLELRGGSNGDNRSASTHASGRVGSFAWHLEGFGRDADDVEIPSGALDEEPELDILENSAIESTGGAVGAAWIGPKSSFGISFRGFDTLYGIPGGHGHGHDEEHEGEEHEGEEHEHEDEEHGEEAVRIDLRQRRVDLRALRTAPIGPFRTIKLNLGVVDYEHVELEGEEIGTLFENESWEARLEAAQVARGSWTGDVGVQLSERDFAAIGEEAFVAPNTTRRAAVFALQQYQIDAVTLVGGLRFETQDTSSSDPSLPDRDFDGASVSVGALWDFAPTWKLSANLARSTKLPTPEELYSFGPHLATNAFEIGDPDLTEETSLGADLSLRRTSGRVNGELTVFVNRFDDFILLEPTDEVEDDLPVFRYGQTDAEFRGIEGEVHFELLEVEPHHLELELSFDQVRAEERATGTPLPLIPPRRLGAALLYRGDTFDGKIEVRRNEAQDRLAAAETRTPGSTILNASLGFRFFLGDTLHRLELRGTNLTDEVVRVHTSFLKDRVVAPGRDVSLMYRLDW